jgi:hypothetical protein
MTARLALCVPADLTEVLELHLECCAQLQPALAHTAPAVLLNQEPCARYISYVSVVDTAA